ncbi:hypothetical protein NM688_g3730 [Phlebia brevispora]|uniref:Uncharacterized protein n=1 Tax=Phlebia brevispora TaxID=194682 RepID=A0ACC1T551_9APHY|nr:hypothetical protein NM688_g3730 [Phlebia brevispora]
MTDVKPRAPEEPSAFGVRYRWSRGANAYRVCRALFASTGEPLFYGLSQHARAAPPHAATAVMDVTPPDQHHTTSSYFAVWGYAYVTDQVDWLVREQRCAYGNPEMRKSASQSKLRVTILQGLDPTSRRTGQVHRPRGTFPTHQSLRVAALYDAVGIAEVVGTGDMRKWRIKRQLVHLAPCGHEGARQDMIGDGKHSSFELAFSACFISHLPSRHSRHLIPLRHLCPNHPFCSLRLPHPRCPFLGTCAIPNTLSPLSRAPMSSDVRCRLVLVDNIINHDDTDAVLHPGHIVITTGTRAGPATVLCPPGRYSDFRPCAESVGTGNSAIGQSTHISLGKLSVRPELCASYAYLFYGDVPTIRCGDLEFKTMQSSLHGEGAAISQRGRIHALTLEPLCAAVSSIIWMLEKLFSSLAASRRHCPVPALFLGTNCSVLAIKEPSTPDVYPMYFTLRQSHILLSPI